MEEHMSNQKVDRTKQNQRIALTKGKIRQHRDDKKDVHVQTRAYGHAKATLLEHRHIVLQGKPGDGKTYTALSIIADLMEMYQEMQPVEVNKPNEWEELVDMKQPLIIFMDDVLGKYGISETDLGQWKRLSELIHPNITDSSVFLIVCLRDQNALKVSGSLQRNEAFSWMFDSNVINISDERYYLTREEKTEMLMKYATKHKKQTDKCIIDSVVDMKNVIGFPRNCQIWSSRQDLALKEVYSNNVFLIEEIQHISRECRQDYLFLALLMLSGGSVSLEDDTELLRNQIKKISELCGVREEFSIDQYKEIGHSLCNTFVEYDTDKKTFRFQDDCTESAVLFSFGSDNPQITLELCSLQALTKMCCLRKECKSPDDESLVKYKITLDDDTYFKIIVERFRKGLESKQRELFQCIAEALVWRSSRFSEYFLKTLTTSDDVLKFLSKKDPDQQSILTYFIYADNTFVVKQIVDKLSQFNFREHHLVSRQVLLAAVNACLSDKADILNYLIEFQNKVDDFVMFAAVAAGNVSVMQKLVLHGGNLKATISDKLRKDLTNTIKNCVSYPNDASYHHDINLLHIACNYGRIDMVKYLKTNCAELLHKTSSIGFTVSHFVARSENVELMKLLSAEKLDIERKTRQGHTVLHIAAANGNAEMVKYLTETFPEIAHQTSRDGWTALHSSGLGGSIHVLKALLEKRLDIKARTNDGKNVLHISAWNNHLPVVKHLIETYPELVKQTDTDGKTAVHYAASRGDEPVMVTLIQAGLDITARTNDGSHVLHIASDNNNLSMVNYLIKTVPQLIHQTNKCGETALHCAGKGGSVRVIDTLLRAGLNIMARSDEGHNVLHSAALSGNSDKFSTMDYLIKMYPQLKDDITNNGWTMLHCCSTGGDMNVMELLLQEGFDIKARTKEGNNVLHIAARNKNLALVNFLIKECPQLIEETSNQGLTSIHEAARGGDVQVIEALIKAGSDIMARTNAGNNILHITSLCNNLSAMKYLIKAYPELKQGITNNGWTVLHYCSQGGGVKSMEFLLQEGFDIKTRTVIGYNALHIAARNKNLAIVNYLIKVCPQLVQESNNQGCTAVHEAAQGGDVKVMEALIKAGSDIMAKNNEGHNILHLAALRNNLSAMEYSIKTYPQLKHDITNNGWTVLHCCSQGGGVKSIELLLKEGFDSKARTTTGCNTLHIAAANKNLAIVNYLIEKYPQLVQESNNQGFTALHEAAQGGDVNVIEALIKAGSDIMARGNKGHNILHLAALRNNLSVMKYLVKTYPLLKHDITNNEWTVLHCCSEGGDTSAMEILLQEGFDIRARTKDGDNALHIAAGNNNLGIVNYLIEQCPQLVKETNNQGLTAVHTAVQGDVQVIEALVMAGSDIMARSNEGFNILHLAALCNNLSTIEYLMKTYPQLKHGITDDGWTVLHCCSGCGGMSALQLMLKEGFDITSETKDGLNALQFAVVNKNLAVANYLIKKYPQLVQETIKKGYAAFVDGQVTESMITESLDILQGISIEDFVKAIFHVPMNRSDTNVNLDIDLD